jgi:asparagine synthase (glutamine-hydrolysing)
MCSLLEHRGPDDEAFYTNGNASIGMTRLAILDLRKGLYPLSNESNSLHLFYNGEIYNFSELSSDLVARGHQFTSLTDGEVVVHGFEEWGPTCCSKFNGMWAFALWDSTRQELILARDHFGIKPLYYYIDQDFLAFSSEIGALLSLPFIKRTPNERRIYNYLVDGRVDHTDETFFDDIFRLPPGHYAIAKRDGAFERFRYWQMPSVCEEGNGDDMAEASKRVRDLFVDAVRVRLRSDVPVGTCLSGGLDSSSIVSVIAGLNERDKKSVGNRLQGFSACFPGDPIDESHFIEIAAQKTGTESHPVYPTALEFWRDLTELVRTQDEPFVGASIYASWRVMQLAKSYDVPVLLDGQGGDELFAGYPEYLGFYLKDLLRRGKLITALKELSKSIDLTARMVPLWITYQLKIGNTTKEHLNPAFAAKFGNDADKRRLDQGPNLAQIMWNDLTRYILPSLLRYEDKNSMHFSIETRLPFLDPRLVEYVASLPIDFKIRGGWTKRIFREAMRGIVPEEIRVRRDKIAFETPQARWFLRGFPEEIEGILSGEMRVSEFVQIPSVLKLFQKARKRKKISRWDSELVWRCINLEMWLREYIPSHRDVLGPLTTEPAVTNQ